jgi:hypothetical protein
MDMSKFISLLRARALFFCRSDLFDDKFEGSYPKGSALETLLAQLQTEQASNPSLEDRVPRNQQGICVRQQFRESVLVNCWHINDDESAAMWSYMYLPMPESRLNRLSMG